ncbi:MAG TPA: S8 family serine peptidase [Pyrinomonadaceae bacterium]|nr:S8 family serine peptidase [Pyrinomonadaceae bacterium]
MRRNRVTTTLGLLAALAAAAVVSWGGATPAGAQSSSKDKVSADLRQKLSSGGKLNVVITAASSWNKTLDDAVKSNNGTVTKTYGAFAVRAASLPAAAVEAMAARSDVGYVALDRDVQVLGHVSLTSGADAARVMGNYNPTYDGTGVGIAVLDSGVDPNHTAMTVESGSASRVVKSVDFTGEGRTDDPYGHGTHVAGIAAGNGQVSNSSYVGIAPNASIINLRVLNSQGVGSVSALLAALDWIKTNKGTYNIRVVNMSLGTSAVDSYKNDPLCLAVRSLVNSNVVVVAAAGNEGKDSSGTKLYGQIHSPGIDPSVITVGAANTYGTDARNDDAVTTYSSRGPTRSFWTDSYGTKHYDNLVKPDVIAPGNKIIDAQAAGNLLVTQNPTLDANVSGSSSRDQMYLSGTSMAAPVVSGAAALLLQANPKLTPNLVKALLMYTAQQLPGFNTFEQGAGEINLEGAMRLARLVRTDLSNSTPVGTSMLTGSFGSQQTTIAGYQFDWSQGIIMDQTFATGTNLITKYQAVYNLGALLADGTKLSASGTLLADGSLLSDGVILSDSILVSNGSLLSDGSPFLACGSLLSDGVILMDGSLLSDGVIMGDGTLLSDGTLLADVSGQANLAMIRGDNTASMAKVVESAPPAAPSGLKAAAASKSQINLTWADNSNDETGFRVECSTDGVNFTLAQNAGANAKSYSWTGLSGGKKYYFRVRAFSANGNSAYTSVAYATTPTK